VILVKLSFYKSCSFSKSVCLLSILFLVTVCSLPSLANKVKKGKADHARMGVGGVLISLTLAVSPQVDKPLKSVSHGQCDARPTVLPSRTQSITALWLVPN